MHNKLKGFIVQTLMISVLGHAVSIVSTAGQESQDRGTRTQAGPPPSLQRKLHCLEAQVQKWQQEGKDPQPIGDIIMEDFRPLMEQQKFAEAEQVMDRALKLAGGTCPDQPTSPLGAEPPQAGQPPSLQRKRQCLEAQIQKWQEEGKDPQPIGEILQDFPPLFEQQNFAEAERVVDRALKVAGGTCPDQSTSKPGAEPPRAEPPLSLQEKMQGLQALVEQKQDDGVDLRPFMEVMQGLGPLVEQHKFSEAEALVDRASKLLAESVPPNEPSAAGVLPLIAYGARDADGRQQIFVVKPDGSGIRRLTQEGKHNFFPAWSPNGRRLAFTSDRSSSLQIWVMKADGTGPRQLTTEGENDVPTWSPDGKQIAFASKRTGHSEIWTMESDGTHQTQLTTTDTAVVNSGPAWSPDGRRIAFYSTRSGHFAIWVMDPDGGHLTQLTTPYGDSYPDSNAPAWSPDGTKIAFWSGLAHEGGNVWVVNADGGNRKQLTNQPTGVNCDEPAWSADGMKIMFASNRPGSEGIGNWIMDADGNNQRVFSTNTYTRGRPSWQPVGSKR